MWEFTVFIFFSCLFHSPCLFVDSHLSSVQDLAHFGFAYITLPPLSVFFFILNIFLILFILTRYIFFSLALKIFQSFHFAFINSRSISINFISLPFQIFHFFPLLLVCFNSPTSFHQFITRIFFFLSATFSLPGSSMPSAILERNSSVLQFSPPFHTVSVHCWHFSPVTHARHLCHTVSQS